MALYSHYSRGPFRILLLFVLLFTYHHSTTLIAETTGKIAGSIQYISTGEPLIGANIIVNDTPLGAAADNNGQFVILNRQYWSQTKKQFNGSQVLIV